MNMEKCKQLYENGTILYQSGNEIQKRMAYQISLALEEVLGIKIPFSREIADEEAINWILCDESDCVDGSFLIRVCEKDVLLFADSYYGYEGIARALKTDAAKEILANVKGAVLQGKYTDYLGEFEQSNRYAYDRRGDHRVLFYNFLHHSGSGTRKDYLPNDIPADKRNVLQQEMIAQYLPDVVAGQELAYSKRYAMGLYDIALLLSDIGYKETIDPRVCNIREDLYGKGGKPFRVGQNTCFTRCNASPLFYNTKTTKCIKSDYYLFERHFDEDYPHKSAEEAASKALTWGVFESKKTKDRYIVISAHMSWGGGKMILHDQAVEVVALIEKLTAKYPYPVFFGGDINGNRGCQNYDHFVSPEVGYTDIQDHNVAKEFSSKVLPDKGYPCINEELGFMVPDKVHLRYISDEPHKNGIDHIFLPDPSKVEVNVFGVIVDECSLSASDHLPIFADFNLKK